MSWQVWEFQIDRFIENWPLGPDFLRSRCSADNSFRWQHQRVLSYITVRNLDNESSLALPIFWWSFQSSLGTNLWLCNQRQKVDFQIQTFLRVTSLPPLSYWRQSMDLILLFTAAAPLFEVIPPRFSFVAVGTILDFMPDRSALRQSSNIWYTYTAKDSNITM